MEWLFIAAVLSGAVLLGTAVGFLIGCMCVVASPNADRVARDAEMFTLGADAARQP